MRACAQHIINVFLIWAFRYEAERLKIMADVAATAPMRPPRVTSPTAAPAKPARPMSPKPVVATEAAAQPARPARVPSKTNTSDEKVSTTLQGILSPTLERRGSMTGQGGRKSSVEDVTQNSTPSASTSTGEAHCHRSIIHSMFDVFCFRNS